MDKEKLIALLEEQAKQYRMAASSSNGFEELPETAWYKQKAKEFEEAIGFIDQSVEFDAGYHFEGAIFELRSEEGYLSTFNTNGYNFNLNVENTKDITEAMILSGEMKKVVDSMVGLDFDCYKALDALGYDTIPVQVTIKEKSEEK